jgi:hypothetical protein
VLDERKEEEEEGGTFGVLIYSSCLVLLVGWLFSASPAMSTTGRPIHEVLGAGGVVVVALTFALTRYMYGKGKVKRGMSSSSEDCEMKIQRSRERNREHAKRTRLRKKVAIESMKDRLIELQNEVSQYYIIYNNIT